MANITFSAAVKQMVEAAKLNNIANDLNEGNNPHEIKQNIGLCIFAALSVAMESLMQSKSSSLHPSIAITSTSVSESFAILTHAAKEKLMMYMNPIRWYNFSTTESKQDEKEFWINSSFEEVRETILKRFVIDKYIEIYFAYLKDDEKKALNRKALAIRLYQEFEENEVWEKNKIFKKILEAGENINNDIDYYKNSLKKLNEQIEGIKNQICKQIEPEENPVEIINVNVNVNVNVKSKALADKFTWKKKLLWSCFLVCILSASVQVALFSVEILPLIAAAVGMGFCWPLLAAFCFFVFIAILVVAYNNCVENTNCSFIEKMMAYLADTDSWAECIMKGLLLALIIACAITVTLSFIWLAQYMAFDLFQVVDTAYWVFAVLLPYAFTHLLFALDHAIEAAGAILTLIGEVGLLITGQSESSFNIWELERHQLIFAGIAIAFLACVGLSAYFVGLVVDSAAASVGLKLFDGQSFAFIAVGLIIELFVHGLLAMQVAEDISSKFEKNDYTGVDEEVDIYASDKDSLNKETDRLLSFENIGTQDIQDPKLKYHESNSPSPQNFA